ncbi:MAG: hypothetical protein WCT36_02215 [Candidatus Gracilibacteria bacterium]|jgi:hypothetical protein
MLCQNPNCVGEKEFELTEQETRLLGEFDVDPISMVFCRQCREMRRIAFRNERALFKRKCAQTDKEIWSIYSEAAPFKIFDKDVWWGDSWDGITFGKNFDFEKTFFQQFYELMLEVPRPSLIQAKNQNSMFTNDSNNNNDCYMVFTADDNVNCHYGSFILCKDSMDSEELTRCELCYDCLFCTGCHSAVACENCMNCSNVYFSSNLVNCHNCIFSFGLRDQKNCIFNTEVSPDVFMTFMLQRQLFRRRSYKKAKEMFHMFLETTPQRYMYLLKAENSTGDRLTNSKDCENCYSGDDIVGCSNMNSSTFNLRDCMDCWAIAYGTQKSFENQTCLRGGMNFVGNFSNDCSSCFYIDNCQMCQDCFGCIGLKNKKFCILNRQYSADEYKILKQKIIKFMKQTKEWGQFFPFWMSPFAYNTTVADVWYPYEKEKYAELLKKSEELWKPPASYKKTHLWHVDKAKAAPDKDILPPDSLYEAKNDEILATTFYDVVTKKPFKITGRELALHQQMKVPLPENAFDLRYRERFHRYNPRKLYARRCQKCSKNFQTTFPPDSPYIVFCEQCFNDSLL